MCIRDSYSAVHCGMLEELGVADRIAGVCESRYIDLSFVREWIERGTIADLGEASSPDLERMIALSPDALLVSPFENTGYGRVEKSGIPLLELADYMEAEPMGRVDVYKRQGLAYVTNRMSVAVRGLQSGQIQQYAFVFLLGTVVITVLVLVF